MAKKKTVAKMGVKKAAQEAAKRAKTQSPQRLGTSILGLQRVTDSTARIARKNTRGGKLTLGDKVMLSRAVTSGSVGEPSFKSKSEYKAAQVIQSRRGAETSRTASRAKGIAKRQAKVAKARRAKKALGN